jgi:hypothetical protein
MIRAAQERAARKRYREMALVLNEQSRRRFIALEAQALGRGGVSLMARISGLARSTIYQGLSDIRDKVVTSAGRIRKEGGGRKKKAIQDLTLVVDLKNLVEPVTRGDPTQPLLWTSRSLRNLAKELAKKGDEVCPAVVGNLLRDTLQIIIGFCCRLGWLSPGRRPFRCWKSRDCRLTHFGRSAA